jgi:hypothetical protein
MVRICIKPYNNNTDYQEQFDRFPYALSDFQKYAIEAIASSNHVLVTAHTGSGKTLPAEFAIQYFVEQGKKVIYTSPIKALSNQKFYEFTQKYPHISFGLFTGDIKTNPEADVLIMTTEILMNRLFVSSANSVSRGQDDFQIDLETELACVIFDECHYINDPERGQVWEKSMMMLPFHVQMVMLSATIDNPAGFAGWCEEVSAKKLPIDDSDNNNTIKKKEVYLASTNHRVVPLTHYGFLTINESFIKTLKDKVLEKQIRDSTNKIITLQTADGKLMETGIQEIARTQKLFDTKGKTIAMKRQAVLNNLTLFLKEREMLPAIAFVFSRKQVEVCAKEIMTPLLEDDSKVPYIVRRECEQMVRKLPNYQEFLELPEYNSLVALLEKGIGIHHSGMIPVLREIVELLISKKYIKLLFATESFAIGLDCPIKTAIFTSLTKFDGKTERLLLSHEYTQMAGRAGRRGIDTVGHVIHCNNLFPMPTLSEYRAILSGKPQELVSKYHISYSVILNLMKNGISSDFHEFSENSMMRIELTKSIARQRASVEDLNRNLETKRKQLDLLRLPYDKCLEYILLENTATTAVNKKRKDLERKMREIQDLSTKTWAEDVKFARGYTDLVTEMDEETATLEYMEDFIVHQTEKICRVLMDGGFIHETAEENHYELTPLGKMAANLAEVHPLIFSEHLVKTDFFAALSPTQLVGLFSCFTTVNVKEEYRRSVPNSEDRTLNGSIQEVAKSFREYDDREAAADIRTGIDYENALQYDMMDFAMRWCDCATEAECKELIQTEIADLGISIGDFTKAMLKIVAITRELAKVADEGGETDFAHRLHQIEGLVLKYVTTSQSLYV